MRMVFLLMLIALGGCASTQISINDATEAPSERIIFNQRLPLEGNAVAFFVRDSGFIGSAVYLHLYIDGKEAAILNPGEKVDFVLPPGAHIFGVVPTNPLNIAPFNSIDQNLNPGGQYFYRIQTNINSGTALQRYFP
jgi:hypothetical protein